MLGYRVRNLVLWRGVSGRRQCRRYSFPLIETLSEPIHCFLCVCTNFSNDYYFLLSDIGNVMNSLLVSSLDIDDVITSVKELDTRKICMVS